MGVIERAKNMSHGGDEERSLPYVCLSCDTGFEVQHHSCPTCESFDIRRSKWVGSGPTPE